MAGARPEVWAPPPSFLGDGGLTHMAASSEACQAAGPEDSGPSSPQGACELLNQAGHSSAHTCRASTSLGAFPEAPPLSPPKPHLFLCRFCNSPQVFTGHSPWGDTPCLPSSVQGPPAPEALPDSSG